MKTPSTAATAADVRATASAKARGERSQVVARTNERVRVRRATSVTCNPFPEANCSEALASVLKAVPTYEYKCPNGHVFEVFKRITDPPPAACEVCGASPVETVLYPVPVHFRGSGFYSTDYGRGKQKREAKEEAPAKSDEKKDKPAEKKAAEA
jgi:putative FmdB family regulatory protein